MNRLVEQVSACFCAIVCSFVQSYCSPANADIVQSSVFQPFYWNGTFWTLERLDCSWNPRSDRTVCSIPSGQKQHFSVLSNLHKKTPIDTGVCV